MLFSKINIRKFSKKISVGYHWYKRHIAELLVIITAFIASYMLSYIPYLSIIVGLVPSLPFIVAIILGFVILKPRFNKIILLAMILLLLSMPFTYIHLIIVAELLSEIAYTLLFTIIITFFINTVKKES